MELEDYNCVLCNGQVEETLEHLFLFCPFAAECWNYLNLSITPVNELLDIVQQLKIQLNQPLFMEVIILQCWAIWMTRNNQIFKAIPATVQGCKRLLCLELEGLVHRIKRKKPPQVSGMDSKLFLGVNSLPVSIFLFLCFLVP
jgi:hypothetical protein